MSGAEAVVVGIVVATLGAGSLTLARVRDGRAVARQRERLGRSGRTSGETDTETRQ